MFVLHTCARASLAILATPLSFLTAPSCALSTSSALESSLGASSALPAPDISSAFSVFSTRAISLAISACCLRSVHKQAAHSTRERSYVLVQYLRHCAHKSIILQLQHWHCVCKCSGASLAVPSVHSNKITLQAYNLKHVNRCEGDSLHLRTVLARSSLVLSSRACYREVYCCYSTAQLLTGGIARYIVPTEHRQCFTNITSRYLRMLDLSTAVRCDCNMTLAMSFLRLCSSPLRSPIVTCVCTIQYVCVYLLVERVSSDSA
jgi:hypothetical protein